MANMTIAWLSSILIVTLVIASSVISWEYSKEFTTLKKDGVILARYTWVVEAERTWRQMNYAYQMNTCIKVGGEVRYYDTIKPRCYYQDDYFEQLRRSLIKTEISEFNGTILKEVPNYRYGTRGVYAGVLYEQSMFIETKEPREFPKQYLVDWDPEDTRNYKLTWRVTNLKEQPLANGNYSKCKYTAKNLFIDLKSDC